MSDFIVVLVTVGSADEGATIADALVSEQLAACVNILGPIRSHYVWKGELPPCSRSWRNACGPCIRTTRPK